VNCRTHTEVRFVLISNATQTEHQQLYQDHQLACLQENVIVVAAAVLGERGRPRSKIQLCGMQHAKQIASLRPATWHIMCTAICTVTCCRAMT